MQRFPRLEGTHFEITSPCDAVYNCIAWAAGKNQEFWWPGKGNWPPGAPTTDTRLAFIRAFETIGYAACDDGEWEDGFEKIVLYEKLGRPKHAARMLSADRWTSKLGQGYDITHTLDGLNGNQYGKPTLFMRRPVQPVLATL
ncbi:MAG: hypothetical protein DI605_01170 [Sphingomonas sp.]|nr:MAG: hypothetical protein DI605_01170 [Sphingomonas sp.]